MDWLHWHLLDQIATETDQSLLIFSPFCSLVSLLMPAQCLLVCTRILKETWRNICLDWKKTGSRGKAGQNVVVQKSSFKFPSNYWHDTRSMPAIFFAVSNLVQSSRYQAGMIWLQYSQSMRNLRSVSWGPETWAFCQRPKEQKSKTRIRKLSLYIIFWWNIDHLWGVLLFESFQ